MKTAHLVFCQKQYKIRRSVFIMQEARPNKLQNLPDEHTTPTIVDPASSANGEMSKQLQQNLSSSASGLPYRRRRAGLPLPLLILVIFLVGLLVVSGLGLMIFAETTQYRTTLHTATTTVKEATSSALQTALARQHGTSEALGTAQANIEASATAQADLDAQSTATVEQASATAQALNTFYNQATNGNPAFDDPLSDNTGPGKWDEGSSGPNTGCYFTQDTYHVREAQNGNLQPCLAQSTHFSNFAYQVRVNIQQGLEGSAGLLFRVGNDDQSYYFFHISPNGLYALDRYTGQNKAQTLLQSISGTINMGLDTDNEITVIASKTALYLYANGEYLTSLTENKLSTGKIGLAVVSQNGPIDAEFSDIQVWELRQQNPGEKTTPTPANQLSPTPSGTSTPTATQTLTGID
jgi:hypothetical protein